MKPARRPALKGVTFNVEHITPPLTRGLPQLNGGLNKTLLSVFNSCNYLASVQQYVAVLARPKGDRVL